MGGYTQTSLNYFYACHYSEIWSLEVADMQCEMTIRPASETDWEARAALVRSGLASHHYDTFIFFFFQELTLQAVALSGAVLFIFAGASLHQCALLLPLAAAFVATAVLLTHYTLANKQAQRLRGELAGWVAECGPAHGGAAAELRQVVGTLSVGAARGGGRLQALSVAPRWRRRGVARALLAAVRHALPAHHELHALVSRVQAPARQLLHSDGWEARGWYHRRVVGAALTLPVAVVALRAPQFAPPAPRHHSISTQY